MDLITSFPLGDDIAVTLLVLATLSILALVAGAVIPARLGRPAALEAAGEDADDEDDAVDADDSDAADDADAAEEKRRRRTAKLETSGRSEKSAKTEKVRAEKVEKSGKGVRSGTGGSDSGSDPQQRHDGAQGRWLGAHLTAAGSVMLWVGVPALLLLYLVPGSTDIRILRSAMMLVGILVGLLAAWRGLALQTAVQRIEPEARAAWVPRLGGLTVTGALALAILPVVIILWFMQELASSGLVALAAGAALSALALRAAVSSIDTAATSSALLVGAEENELRVDDDSNLGTPHLRIARMFRRGAAGSADIVAVTLALAAMGVLLGVPVLAGEGILVVLLGLGVALLTAAAGAVLPRIAAEGRESAALRLAGIVPAVLGGVGMTVAAALWLPSAYQDLRFSHVGLDQISEAAVTGGEPVPRADLEEQLLTAGADMSQWLSAADDSTYSGALIDILALYQTSPSAVTAGALGLGVVIALAAALLVGTAADRHRSTVLRAARTSRTGGPLGVVAALGSTALTAAGALALVVLAATVLSVLSAGVPGLALALLVHAGLGALVVAAGFAGSLAAPALLEEPGTDPALRSAAAGAALAPRTALLLAAVLPALGALGPVVTAIQVAPRAGTVWQDRALHALTPTALPVLAGIALGMVAMLLVIASLLDSARRTGARSVVETRAAVLEGGREVRMDELPPAVRRGATTPVIIGVLTPIVAGFGLGAAALPGVVIGVVVVAAGLGLWTLATSTVLEGATDVIEAGRYGGPGSWAHSGALNGAVLTGVLRGAIGGMALPMMLVTSQIAAVSVSSLVSLYAADTSEYLLWGVALLGILVAGTSWVIAATAPEIDLEDSHGELSTPLFSRPQEDTGDTLDSMSWEDEEQGR
ncbi:MAG TPA: pyrophosphatase [Candidatus Brachybacterium merdigallinarum]|nr:pyrophosphatase [Candidatus Brachybacterium merdigallinarum]